MGKSIKMMVLCHALFLLFLVDTGLTAESFTSQTFFLPKPACQFSIPRGYQKSRKATHDPLETYRLSLLPDHLTETEKMRRTKLEAIFHKTLNEDLLPERPFFTLQIRDTGRQINKKDIDIQRETFAKMYRNPVEMFKDIDTFALLEYLFTTKFVEDKRTNSYIIMYSTRIAGDEKEFYVLQFFRFYRTGLIIFNFYSDKEAIKEDI